MTLSPIPLPDARISLDPSWLPDAQADALFKQLHAAIPWEVHRLRLFGRSVDSPRLSCWIGDPGTSYRYSGVDYAPRPWPAALLPIRTRLRDELGIDFNSALANLYRDGQDCMGWHSDNETDLGPRPSIASLSLGAQRRFVLKRRPVRGQATASGAATEKLALELGSGSLLLMQGQTQRHYRHALPRTARQVGQRINLTFRRIRPS